MISVTITERRAGIYVVALVLAVALSLLTGQKPVEDYPMSDQASFTDRTRGSFSALADDLLAGEGLLPLPLPAFSTGAESGLASQAFCGQPHQTGVNQ